jgi:hypothetical protein
MENAEGLCRAAREEGLIIRLLDGELSPSEEHRVLTHLRTCPDCLGLAADLLYTDGRIRQLLLSQVAEEARDKKDKPSDRFMLEVDKLPVGKSLDRDLLDEDDNLLVAAGTIITPKLVEAIKRRGIEKLAVRSVEEPEPEEAPPPQMLIVPVAEMQRITAEGPVEPAVTEFVRSQCLAAVDDCFKNLEQGGTFEIHEVREASLEVAEQLLDRPQASLTLADLILVDPGLHAHSVNVLILFLMVARAMGHPVQLIREHATAALLHDIGRIVLRRASAASGITRTPGEEDMEHPEAGYTYLWNMGGIGQSALKMVMNHHERFDGAGYPRQLKGTTLSDWDQLLILANTYDSLTWNRETGLRSGFHAALASLIQDGSKFVRKGIIQAVIQTFGHYPPGSWVRMSSGEIGVVTKAHPGSPLKPFVTLLYDRGGHKLGRPKHVDLIHSQSAYIQGPVPVDVTMEAS